jgi:hypothetical protein
MLEAAGRRGRPARVRALIVLCAALSAGPAHAQADEPVRIGRWVTLREAELGVRVRSQRGSDGAANIERLEHRVAVGGQFAIDQPARRRLVFGAYTGNGYGSGWNASGIGGTFSPTVYLKHLYAAISIGRHLEVEYGSLYPIPGRSTTTVGYDNDGYLAGQRVRLTKATRLFDHITATYAHFGTTGPQQFTGRLSTLWRPNLAQVYVRKELTPGWTVAGDYMAGAGTRTVRLALAGTNRVGLDTLGIEAYRERARPRGFGFGAHATRSLTPRVSLRIGYGDIDSRQALLSGTEFFDGRRIYAQTEMRVTRGLSGRVLWTQAFANARPIAAARRVEVGLWWNVLALHRD